MGWNQFELPHAQTTLAAGHTSGSGLFQISDPLVFPSFTQAAYPGTVVSVTAKIKDNGSGGTNTTVSITGFQVTGTSYVFSPTFTSGADQNFASGGTVDNTSAGYWSNNNGNALAAAYTDGTGRNTGYPTGLASGQQIQGVLGQANGTFQVFTVGPSGT
jgi:hypothetical protein